MFWWTTMIQKCTLAICVRNCKYFCLFCSAIQTLFKIQPLLSFVEFATSKFWLHVSSNCTIFSAMITVSNAFPPPPNPDKITCHAVAFRNHKLVVINFVPPSLGCNFLNAPLDCKRPAATDSKQWKCSRKSTSFFVHKWVLKTYKFNSSVFLARGKSSIVRAQSKMPVRTRIEAGFKNVNLLGSFKRQYVFG